MSDLRLSPNQLTFIALANEYCHALENARETERSEFIDSMLRMLPRIYMSAFDLASPSVLSEDTYIPASLEEDYYSTIMMSISRLLGEDDTYLEVFEDDMKYSETPIPATISEGLADIFQVLYNFIECIREAPLEIIEDCLYSVKDDFHSFWSQTLCNVFRAINALKNK